MVCIHIRWQQGTGPGTKVTTKQDYIAMQKGTERSMETPYARKSFRRDMKLFWDEAAACGTTTRARLSSTAYARIVVLPLRGITFEVWRRDLVEYAMEHMGASITSVPRRVLRRLERTNGVDLRCGVHTEDFWRTQKCACCNKSQKHLRACSLCNTYFCGKDCMREAWKHGGHKLECKWIQSLDKKSYLSRHDEMAADLLLAECC